MTYSNDIRKLFDLKDPNIIFDTASFSAPAERIRGVEHKIITARLTYTPETCAKCGTTNEAFTVIKNGSKISRILLGHLNLSPITLKLKKQRFFCKACHQSFCAETALVDRHCFISNLVKLAVALELQQTQAMTDIAHRLTVSPSTVIRVLEAVGETLDPDITRLPKHLSFDEFKSVKAAKGAMSFVYADSENRKLINIVENRQQSELLSYFHRYPYPVRQAVETVTIDMYSPYLSVIASCFPNAQVIIDRFHIVQHLNRALNRCRVEVMNQLRYSRPRDYRKLKKLWKLVLKNEWDLDFTHYQTHRLFEGVMTEKMIVDYLLNLDEDFAWIYHFINKVKHALHTNQFQAFQAALEQSRQRPLKRYVRTAFQSLERYLTPIEASFHYALSNGPIEGMNNKTKTLKRTGYGYRRFQHFRYRILIINRLTETKGQSGRPVLRPKQTA